jgi:hypothetical protein
MAAIGIWTGNPLWTYLVRYDGQPLWSTTWLSQRLLDWPNFSSVQACDNVVDAATGLFALQYKSFPPYGPFTASNGGDVLAICDDGFIRAIGTQDGAHPYFYYFDGPDGWVIAGPDLCSGSAPAWHNYTAMLTQSPVTPNNAIGQPSPAWTNYIRDDRCQMPIDLVGGTTIRSCIISEHYNGADPTKANNMERFCYAQWLGLAWWERYDLPTVPSVPGAVARAGPPVAYGYPSLPPLNPTLVLTDCRRWLNWTTAANPQFSVSQAGWPPPLSLPSYGR